MKSALVVKNLSKGFPVGFRQRRKAVLKNVNFSVLEGTVTGFIGVNGSGKTTSIKSVLRFIYPDKEPAASIEFFGQPEFNMEIKKKIGYLPERPYLPEQLTAEEFLYFHWKLGGGYSSTAEFKERAAQLLKRVNLSGVEKSSLRGFSKGMLQRMGLAQALLHKPEFLILDEPMSGLDPDGRRIVKDIIRQEHQRGATIFFSSHLLADMDELCSHLVVIDQGEIHFNGAVEDFTDSSIENSTIAFVDSQLRRQQVTVTREQLQLKIFEILNLKGQIIRVQPLETSIESVFTQRKWLEHKNKKDAQR